MEGGGRVDGKKWGRKAERERRTEEVVKVLQVILVFVISFYFHVLAPDRGLTSARHIPCATSLHFWLHHIFLAALPPT